MTELTTTKQGEEKEESSRKSIIILQIFALFFFFLSLAATIVIMLLPLEGFLRGKFSGTPARTLWLLLTFGVAFSIVLHVLGAPQLRRSKYSIAGGTTSLILGFLCGIEIFLLKAQGGSVPNSLWWLFAVLTVLGIVGVYLPERAKRLKEAEEKRKAEEALLKGRRTRPMVFRFKAQRYYVYENKILVYKV